MKKHYQKAMDLKRKNKTNKTNRKLEVTQKMWLNSKKIKAIFAILALGILLIFGIIDWYAWKSGLFELIEVSATMIIELLIFLKE